MTEDVREESEAVWAGVTFFIVGLVVPVLFSSMAQGQDFLSFLVVFGAFSACIVFGELQMTMASGVALGAGLVMASLATFDWWFAGLAVGATLVNIARYAASDSNGFGPGPDDGSLDPVNPLTDA